MSDWKAFFHSHTVLSGTLEEEGADISHMRCHERCVF